MKRLTKRLTAGALALTALTTLLSPASAKQEVVYANLDPSGIPQAVYVVNTFPQGGNIADYGNYSEVRNMTGQQPVQQQDGIVTSEAGNVPFTYEGKLISPDLPWTFSIRYLLDGTEMAADALAGQSGRLQMTIGIDGSGRPDDVFYDHFTLQVAVQLDAGKCQNIDASGATLANVGNSRQMTYTILPKTKTEITIFADVSDFEMPAITISGIYLELNFDLTGGGLGSLEEQLSAFQTGVSAVNTGAQAIKTGSNDMVTGINSLQTSMDSINKGLPTMSTYLNSLFGGATTLSTDMDLLAKQKDELTDKCWKLFTDSLAAAQKQVNALLAAAKMTPVTLTNDNFASQLTGIQTQLTTANPTGGYSTIIPPMITQLQSIRDYYNALLAYTGKIGQAATAVTSLRSGIGEFQTSFKTLSDGYGQQLVGVTALKTGSDKFLENIGKLADGTNQLNTQTADTMTQLSSALEETLGSVTGGGFTPTSFASSQNTQIEMVQFVIKTPAIRKAATAPAPDSTTETTFWQRLQDLF